MPKKKRKGGKGKRIGGAFERTVKKILITSFECLGITPTDVFRSEGSGAGKHAFGDLSLSPSMAKLFPFAIECKTRRKVQLFDFLQPFYKKRSSPLKKFWMQACEGACKSNTLKPLLVFKGNGKTIQCIGFADDLFRALSEDGTSTNILKKKKVPYAQNYVIREGAHHALICFPFAVLLKMLVKKGLKNAKVFGNEGNRVRLRTPDSEPRQQVQKSTRSPRKDKSAHIRTTAAKRLK